MKVVELSQARKEIKLLPKKILEDYYSLLLSLEAGEVLKAPISIPLSSIAKGLYELRLSDKTGQYRVFYLLRVKEAIYVIHAMKKKTQQITSKTKSLLLKRIKEVGNV